MATGRRAAVVVAVANGGCSDAAVEWAAAEAAARACPLRIVHVVPPPAPIDPWGLVPPPGDPLGSSVLGEQVLRTARRRAEAVAPDLDISAHLRGGAVTQVLRRAGEEAGLLVVGGLSRGAVRRMLTGSVSRQLLGQACCPVAVVRPRPALERSSPGPRVVVGLDATSHSSAALEFAFGAAAQRGIPLVVVRGCRPDAPADLEGICGSAVAVQARAADELEQRLSPWQGVHPDVPVRSRLLDADLDMALAEESRGAALLVVGCRARRIGPGTGPGAVRRVVQRAHAPVVVVPDGAAPQAARPRSRRRAPGTDRSGGRSPWE